MLVLDEDFDRLEDFVDAALAEDESMNLRARLENDPALLAAHHQILRERELRTRMFASLEPTESASAKFAARVMAGVQKPSRLWRPLQIAVGIAACVMISFFTGWKIGGKQQATGSATPTIRVVSGPQTTAGYQVALTDESGRVTAVQQFDSLEKAREFSQDLNQWQDRQRQMQDGAAIVVSDRF